MPEEALTMRSWVGLALSMTLLLAACGDDAGGTGNQSNNNNANPFCGDGNLDPHEDCDDGASNSDVEPDACRTDCREHYCGDGVKDSDEHCDDGDDGTNRSDACPNTCLAPVCGDGHVLDGVEACDDGNTLDGDDCRGDCLQLFTDCGNGLPDPGEECDSGTSNSDTVPNRCRRDCRDPWCGDGVVDDGFQEECDDATAMSDTEPNACRTDCTQPRCGDGVRDDAAPSSESCDGTDLGGATCQSELGEAGTLACLPSCSYDFSGCYACGDGHCERALGEDETSCPADCVETSCGDFVDNDSDGQTDCADSDCADAACGSSGNPGTCHAGACCHGCWDGATCQPGDIPAACGLGGETCANCDDNNPASNDFCFDGNCAHS